MDSRAAKPERFSYEAEDGLLFRMLTKEDAARVAVLEKECFSEPWSEQAFCDTVDNPDAFFLTVWQEGQLAGYCGVFRAWTDGDICNVAVEPAKRKQGIGRRMLTLLMEQGERMGIADYTLEVRAGNEPAIRLYEALGFAGEGISPRLLRKAERGCPHYVETQGRACINYQHAKGNGHVILYTVHARKAWHNRRQV